VARDERDRLKKIEQAQKAEADKQKRESSKLGKIDDDADAPAKPASAPAQAPSGKLGGKEDEK